LAKLEGIYRFKHVTTIISNKTKHTLFSSNMEQGIFVLLYSRKIV
jgi:hypothetical protein